MPIIKSAKKRVRVAGKAAARNSKTKRNLRAAVKLFAKSPSAKSHSSVASNIDKSVKKGLMHKNKAARLKRQASLKAKSAGVKNTASTKTKAAAPVKKTTTAKKKTVAKKPAAKK
jgi:small subunit ribosomal protein S20